MAQAKEHFNAMTDLENRLGEIEAQRNFSDLDLSTKMALSLPDSMESIRCNRLSGPATPLTPKNIRQDVISLLKRMNLAQGDTQQPDIAMTSNKNTGNGQRRDAGSSRRNGGRSQTKFKGECFNCGKPGHRQAECRSKTRRNDDDDEAMIAFASALHSGGANPLKSGLRDFVMDNAVSCGHVSTHIKHFKNPP